MLAGAWVAPEQYIGIWPIQTFPWKIWLYHTNKKFEKNKTKFFSSHIIHLWHLQDVVMVSGSPILQKGLDKFMEK